MTTLQITPDEVASGQMRPEHLDAAVAALNEDGIVVLQDVVSRESLETLRAKVLEDVALLQSRPDAPYNWNTGNIQQDPPPFPPYLFKDILLNDLAIAVTRALLGPGVKNAFYSGNTAVRSDQRQPVHADTGQLWQNLESPTPPFQLVVNVPLVSMNPENGATEIWPGTHRDTAVSIHDPIEVPAEALARWREKRPPFQPTVAAGSLVIRDIRLWHAGMPNRTETPRPMVAMIHTASWFSVGELLFPRGTEAFFEHPTLRTRARFVDGPIDYIRAPHAYSYQAPPCPPQPP